MPALLIGKTSVYSKSPFVIISSHSQKEQDMSENVLGYYRNLNSLRYGNEYCVEYWRLVWENPFFLFNWSLFQSRSYNCTWLVRVGLKTEPMHGGGEQANGYAACHSPPNWEGHLAI